MPSQINGLPFNIINTLPNPIAIQSSTNAIPIVVTTAAPHGLTTGDIVTVYSHTVNTSANNIFAVVVTGNSTFQLEFSIGVGVGGATGYVQPLSFGSTFAIPSGGDRPNAASVNVSFEALSDRTAFLQYAIRSDIRIQPNGGILLTSGASMSAVAGSEIDLGGSMLLSSGAAITADAGSSININSGAQFFTNGTSTSVFDGPVNMTTGRKQLLRPIVSLSGTTGHFIDVGQGDLFSAAATGGARVIALNSVSPAPVAGETITIIANSMSTYALDIKRDNVGATIIATFDGGGYGVAMYATFVFDAGDSNWHLGPNSGGFYDGIAVHGVIPGAGA